MRLPIGPNLFANMGPKFAVRNESTQVRVRVDGGHGAEWSPGGRDGGFAAVELRHRAIGRIRRRKDALAGRRDARPTAEQGGHAVRGQPKAAKALGGRDSRGGD